MATTQTKIKTPATLARIVVCDRTLGPTLPIVIVEIDDRLYIDIGSATHTPESLSQNMQVIAFFLLRWLWHYNSYSAKKYYSPQLQTVLVEWVITHGVALNMGFKPTWEVTADIAFAPSPEKRAHFAVDYGTHTVGQAAYCNSLYDPALPKNVEKVRACYQTPLEEVLSSKLATTPVYEANDEVHHPLYKIYDFYRKVTRFFNRSRY